MIIYRVENNQGIGPFNNYLVNNENFTEEQIDYLNGLPLPSSDNGIKEISFDIRYDFKYCGTHTTDLLITWFYEVADILFKHEYEVVAYELPDEDVIIGEYQCIFKKERARKIN